MGSNVAGGLLGGGGEPMLSSVSGSVYDRAVFCWPRSRAAVGA